MEYLEIFQQNIITKKQEFDQKIQKIQITYMIEKKSAESRYRPARAAIAAQAVRAFNAYKSRACGPKAAQKCFYPS